VVLATDIVDKDLKALRNGRWEKAFQKVGGGLSLEETSRDHQEDINRKATIILERKLFGRQEGHCLNHCQSHLILHYSIFYLWIQT